MQCDFNVSVETMTSLHLIEDKLVLERHHQHRQRTPLLKRKGEKKDQIKLMQANIRN